MSQVYTVAAPSCLSSPVKVEGTVLSRSSDPIGAAANQPTRKRRHAAFEDRRPIGLPFSIQADSAAPIPSAQTLVPRFLIPRSCLPLVYLDTLNESRNQSSPLLCYGRIDVLEESSGWNRPWTQPCVLIAESAINGKLLAVEKVQYGLYALCKLGDWVKLESIKTMLAGNQDRVRVEEPEHQEGAGFAKDHWWHSAALCSDLGIRLQQSIQSAEEMSSKIPLCLDRPKTPIFAATATSKRMTTAVLASPEALSHPDTNSGRERPDPMVQASSEAFLRKPAQEVPPVKLDQILQEPQETLNMIKTQYHEALYASKASLAYFAKGPLSRARATFGSREGDQDQSYLTQFLRESILSLTTMDTKYREILPALIKDLPFESLSDDEGAMVIATTSKKIRKSRKSNIGKDGLYPGEELNIMKWWLTRDISSVACDSAEGRDAATRAALLEQRARETQIQIILILEVLALEKSAPVTSIEQKAESQPLYLAHIDASDKKKRKPKKPQDLDTLLDLLVDRLCIWQSTNDDDSKSADNDEKAKDQDGTRAAGVSNGKDQLRQFCVDIVLPFYAARLPNLTKMLCSKLGGPKQPSPRRPPLTGAAISSMSNKPGAPVQRMQNRKPRRTLERVLTDERSASQRPPSLSRSATEPTLPPLKREPSDITLMSIPLNRVAMQKRYSQREVDLNAASQATEARLKKKARVDQELQTAIAALKKPNPRMAVKELVEDAEKRAAISHPRKSKNPIRNPFASVQIMATPSNNRHKDVFGGLPRLPPAYSAAPLTTMQQDIPPSSILRITDSATKPSGSATRAQPSVERKRARLISNVEQTPTRGPLKYSGRRASLPNSALAAKNEPTSQMEHNPAPTSTTIPEDHSLMHAPPPFDHETPTKNSTWQPIGHIGDQVVEVTPIKSLSARPSAADAADTLTPKSLQQEEQHVNVYASLGWDDDIDDLA